MLVCTLIYIYADICSLFNVSVKELWDVVHAKLFAEDGRPSISAELKLQREFGWINRCFESVQVTCDSCFLAPYSSCWARIESGGASPFQLGQNYTNHLQYLVACATCVVPHMCPSASAWFHPLGRASQSFEGFASSTADDWYQGMM